MHEPETEHDRSDETPVLLAAPYAKGADEHDAEGNREERRTRAEPPTVQGEGQMSAA